MKKYNLILLLFGCISLTMISCSAQKKKEQANANNSQNQSTQPYIIFYLSDDQDVYDYGCYGNEKVKTPDVDRIAREGILFENAFTGQAICAPSRSQLFTGKYPLKNGCFANHSKVKPDIVSITKQLRKLGYEVVLAGKSHVSPDAVFNWDKEWHAVERPEGPREYIPIDSIQSYFKTAKKPFCMFITSYYPHSEYFNVNGASANDIKFYPFNESKKNNAAFIKDKAGYYRSIEEDNKQLDQVLTAADNYLGDNTLIIYSADHGVSGKFTVKDIGLKVPFVARWPKVIKPGSKSNQLIHYTDVLPTFMEIAGGKATADMDGKSFLPILKGQDIEINKYVYGVRTNQNILNSEVFPSRMIRDSRYKYIRNFNSIEVVEKNLTNKPNVDFFIRRGATAFKNEPFEELYDLKNDPFEQNNLINKPELKEIKERLIKDLFSWMTFQGDFLNNQPGTMPLIKGKGKAGFRLDEDTPRRKIPDSIKNTLNEEDYLIIKHW
ncbi:sulfatase [Mariniflexile aquimaris]|uniref:Sulfatase n=1 Tax=Mariniflexile aquimaris TaxID=881009 RepID=A0ABW3BTG6_9FLAO